MKDEVSRSNDKSVVNVLTIGEFSHSHEPITDTIFLPFYDNIESPCVRITASYLTGSWQQQTRLSFEEASYNTFL